MFLISGIDQGHSEDEVCDGQGYKVSQTTSDRHQITLPKRKYYDYHYVSCSLIMATHLYVYVQDHDYAPGRSYTAIFDGMQPRVPTR